MAWVALLPVFVAAIFLNMHLNIGESNLTNLKIASEETGFQRLIDFSTGVGMHSFDKIEVYFRDQELRLVNLIGQYENDLIIGCVAWLTSEPVLNALSKCKNVQIIVQKEDFLRPDYGSTNRDEWVKKLNRLYNNIKCNMTRYDFRTPIRSLSIHADPEVTAIRCVGNYNSDKKAAHPRCHHKFLVFCRIKQKKYTDQELGDYIDHYYQPTVLWTGSMNITKNAGQSFENVICIKDSSANSPILEAYVHEHHQIFAISEPLDWESIWCEPEYRIGT